MCLRLTWIKLASKTCLKIEKVWRAGYSSMVLNSILVALRGGRTALAYSEDH